MRTLKCKRVARMISLYVAGDLVGEPERDVAAHLADCESCCLLAAEFSDSSITLHQALTPPEFDAEFYAGIRHAVLEKITRDRMRSKPALFRRPWIYATALAVMVIASGFVLQHFVSNRRALPRDSARAPQATGQGTTQTLQVQSPRKKNELSATPRTPKTEAVALANRHGSFRHFAGMREAGASAQAGPDNRAQIAPSLQAATNFGPVLVEPAIGAVSSASSSSGRASASEVSRIEIQTADPNIRIIWLSPRESREPAEDNHDQDPHQISNRK